MNKVAWGLTASWLGTIASFATDAKSILGLLAALASCIASCYVAALARKNFLRNEPPKPTKPKRKDGPLCLAIALLCLCILAQGCTVLDAAARAVTTTTTNVIEQAQVSTHQIVRLSPTRQPETNFILVTNLVAVTNIEAAVKPAITRTIETSTGLAGIIPPPYGEAAAAGFAIVSILLHGAVKRRNKQLQTIIQGVENSGSVETKKEIRDLSLLTGIAPEIHQLVKKHT
jgi:hypothetical protein